MRLVKDFTHSPEGRDLHRSHPVRELRTLGALPGQPSNVTDGCRPLHGQEYAASTVGKGLS
jgi:hypothetical protein